MDKQRTFFYGFIVAFVLMILPIPHFFFWKDVMDNVEVIFRYGGFVLMVVCGIPLIIDVFMSFLK